MQLKKLTGAGLAKGLLSIAMCLYMGAGTAFAQDPAPTPRIGGNVFGGGRMADVKQTTEETTATINIYASTIVGGVFGGNDVKGSVGQGTADGNKSATITIHDKCTAATTVGEVYGGGNGYYQYKIGDASPLAIGSITDANKATAIAAGTLITVLDKDGNEVASFTTTEATTYAGLLPSIGNTSVTVGTAGATAQNNIKLAEVYGGAKNAYVEGSSGVTIESGTVGRAFAGNNVGGYALSSSLVINNTKAPSGEPIDWTKAGDEWGVAEAFGGGNAVDVLGTANVTVNNGYVRDLFGGNNLADMKGVPDMTLAGGTLNTVYGGGNKGDMKGYTCIVYDVSNSINSAVLEPLAPLGFSTTKYPEFCSTKVIVNGGTGLKINSIYGGCKAANVDHSTYVHIHDAEHIGTVYGGCDIAGGVGMSGQLDLSGGLSYAPDGVGFDASTEVGSIPAGVLPAEYPTPASAVVRLTGGTVSGSVFGGGNGEYAYAGNGDVTAVGGGSVITNVNGIDRPWVNSYTLAVQGGVVNGTIYGGGNMATVGKQIAADPADYQVSTSYLILGKESVDIDLSNATVYAGGRMADVYGPVDVLVKNGMTINRLFAGNDISGSVGGVNRGQFASTYSSGFGTALYNFEDPTAANSAFNALRGTSLTDNNIQVYVRQELGSHITTLFGGGNGEYNYTSGPYAGLNKPEQSSTWLDIAGDVQTSYGGGNAANIAVSNTYITANATVETAFAGGNSATVTQAANLWLDCDAAHGGQSSVDGTYTYADMETDPAKRPNVYTIFGGNNIADMEIVPRVKLWSGSVHTVYGGGNQGDMTGVEASVADLSEYIDEDAFQNLNTWMHAQGYAPSDQNIKPDNLLFYYSTQVIIDQKASPSPDVPLMVGTAYGGCKAANVKYSSYVLSREAAYTGDLYGGCDIAGKVGVAGNGLTTSPVPLYTYDTDPAHRNDPYHHFAFNIPDNFPIVNTASYVRVWDGTVSGNVYGGGNGAYDYAESGSTLKAYPTGAAKTDENLLATVDMSKTTYPAVFATGVSIEGGHLLKNVYGGGNKADVGNDDDVNPWRGTSYLLMGKTAMGTAPDGNTYGPIIDGSVFAGGKMADVHGIVDVIVKAGMQIDKLFAGNDISGQVKGIGRAVSTLGSTFPDGWSTALYGANREHNSFNGTSLATEGIQVYVRIEGKNGDIPAAHISTLFGGGNGDYDYSSGPYAGLTKPTQTSCWLDIKGDVKTSYGGGNAANVAKSNTYITGDAVIETAFAGGNAATVTEAASLWLNCDGARATEAIVNYTHEEVADDPTKRPNVFTIFGGNNIADMNIVPKVELNKGSVNTVYGGGKKGAMRGYRGIVFDVTGFVNPVVLQPMSDLGMNTHNYPDLVGTMLYVNAPGDGLFINKVYGGCMAADVDYSTYVHVNNVQYLNTVYGGCDIAGAVGTQSLITPTSNIGFAFVDGTASTAVIPASMPYPATGSADVIITGGTIHGKIFGGGNGEYTYEGNTVKDADDNVLVTLEDDAQMPWVNSYNMLLQGGDIQGTVYGGGNKATVGKDNGAGSYTVMPSYLFVGKGDGSAFNLSDASVFAGGRMAAVYGPVDVMIKEGATVNTVYAGNDISGSVEGAGRGDFPETFSSDFSTALYHFKDPTGANPDRYKSFNGTSLTNYDGARNDIQIYVRTEAGSTINTLFGGGNGDYDYTAGDYAGLEKPAQSSTWLDIAGNVTTAYGGGNAANIDRSNLCVIGAATVGTIYGGCKAADVTLSTHVFVDKCAVDNSTPHITGNVFGGCDISGNVGLEHTGRYDISSPSETIGHARVQILAGQVDGRVFGGGNGLQDAAGNSYGANALASGTIAGGDDVYAYTDGTYVGKTLPMVENTWVTIKNATIGTTSGSGTHTVFGGGQGAGTRVIHNVDVEVGTTTDNTTVKGINYGGSYAGFVNTNCDDHTRTIILGNGANTKMLGDIYGGSYGNYVRGKIMLNINNVAIGEDDAVQGVYVGNNNAGQPECDASLDFAGNNCNVAIYGGGNMAEFCGTTRITFTHGHVGYIYGGGNNADVYGNTIVEVLGGHVCHDVFGGGNNGAVRVNKASDARNKYGEDYGGNTLVIVRNDCLDITDAEYDIKKEYAVNRNTSQSYRIQGAVDPDAASKSWHELKPSDSGKLSTIQIDGNVYGGGNAADVEGKTTVIIGK